MNVYKNTIANPEGCELVLVEEGEHQNKVEYGDILFTQSSETLEEVGLSSVWLHKASPFLNSFCFGFHFTENGVINPRFIAYSLRTAYMREQIVREGQGATRYNLSSNRLKPIKLVYPSYQEQSKVASLMSRIEKRIEKQEELICTLKKYKRGAIARILSGKSNEFDADATWTEKSLADLCCEFRSGRNISAALIHESGDYPVYGGNGIRGYCDHYSHEGEYVVVGRQGALCGNVRLIQGQNYLSEHAIAVRANEKNDTKFLLYLLDFMNLGQYSDQGAQPGLAVNKLLRLKCNVPEKKTQSKISSFLLTYDKQIAAQERLLSFLTDQRKAFLQQLFI